MSTIVSLIALFCCAISRTIFYFYWAIRWEIACRFFSSSISIISHSILRHYNRGTTWPPKCCR